MRDYIEKQVEAHPIQKTEAAMLTLFFGPVGYFYAAGVTGFANSFAGYVLLIVPFTLIREDNPTTAIVLIVLAHIASVFKVVAIVHEHHQAALRNKPTTHDTNWLNTHFYNGRKKRLQEHEIEDE